MNLQIITRWRKIGHSLKYLEPSKTQPEPEGLDMSPSSVFCCHLHFCRPTKSWLGRMHFCFFFHMKLGLRLCLLEAPLSGHGFRRQKQYLYWTHRNIQRPMCRWSMEKPYNNVLQYWSLLSPRFVSHICLQQCEDEPTVASVWAVCMYQVSLRVKSIRQKILCCCD